MKKISVVIPAYDASETIGACLGAVSRQIVPPHEVIVVDDSSSDATPEIVRGYPVHCVRNETNRGPAHSRNEGARLATGEILLFVDADVAIPEHATKRILEILDEKPTASSVCGIYSVRPLIERGFIHAYRTLQSYHWKRSGCGFTTRFTVSCGAIKREAYEAIGGFDPKFKSADVEDYEVGHRLLEAGYAIYQTDEIESVHDDIGTLADLSRILFRRAFLYFPLLWRRKKLDTGYLNRRRMLTYPLAILSVIALAAPLPGAASVAAWLALVAAIVLLDLGLWRVFLRERSLGFTVACVPVHYLMTLVLAAGFLAGGLRHAIRDGTS